MIEVSNIVVSEAEDVTEPVSLEEAKAWLQVDHDDHDALLTTMITGARQSIEQYLNLALVEKDVTLDADVPDISYSFLPFPYAKSVSDVVVNSVGYDNELTLLVDGEDYYLRGNSIRLFIGLHAISYTVDPGTISQDLKEAIMMEVAERYRARGENNQDGYHGLSEAAKEKANPHQKVWL